MRPRAFAAVHVDGQPEHEARGLALRGQRQQPGGVGGKTAARDGLDARCDPSVRVARGDADGLGAEVEPDQGAADGQMGRKLGDGDDGGGHERA